jgi:hypothetical protein
MKRRVWTQAIAKVLEEGRDDMLSLLLTSLGLALFALWQGFDA